METVDSRRHAVLLALLALSIPTSAIGQLRGVEAWTGGGPKAKSIYSLAVDVTSPNTIYAGAFGSGVFKTTDGGSTWDPATIGLVNTYIRAVAIDPTNPSTVYAGTNDGLSRSVDAGITWSSVLTTSSSVRTVAFDTVSPSTMYAGTFGQGVYKSTDSGTTWAPSSTGLQDLMLRSIVTHPVLTGTALAGTGTGGGVHLTTSAGLFWTQVNDTTGQGAVYELRYDPLDPSRVYAAMADRGVIKSVNGGTSWVRINQGLTSFRTRALAVPDTFRYVGTDTSGVYTTTLNSPAWTQRNSGLNNLMVRALADRPGAPLTVYAGTDGDGVFRTTDGGLQWAPINNLLTDTTGRSLLVRGDGTGTVICGTGFGDGLWRSTDGAATWTRATVGSRNSVLALAEAGSGTLLAAIYGSGVYQSLDGGFSWARTDSASLGNLFVRALSVDPTNGLDLLVGTGNGPWHTTDGGLSWVAWNNGFPAQASVRALARSPADPLVLYAGTDSSGVYTTTDGGASWTASNAGLTESYVRTLAVDPSNPSVVLLGSETGLFRSTDAGASWTAFGTGLPPAASIRALVIDPTAPTRAFVGIWLAGVYRTDDGGATWVSMNTGLPDTKVYSLALDAAAHVLYAGTRLRGVFAYTFTAGATDALVGSGRDGGGLALSSRPNPTVGGTVMTFALSRPGIVTLAVYDTGGRVVRRLCRRDMPAGRHEIGWDGRDGKGGAVASGVYLVRLEAGGGSQVAKVAVIR